MKSPEEFKWERYTPLREVMGRYNKLVDEVTDINQRVESVSEYEVDHTASVDERLHELKDMILAVNFKTDKIQQEFGAKIEDVLRSIRRNHPDI